MRERGLVVDAGDASFAGTLWLPRAPLPAATIVMHPGSGPSDRHNGGYFRPIRERLVAAGYAVCAFDKRGVGGSSGRWQDAGIVEQAGDLLAVASAVASSPGLSEVPIGLFGHSQGGWVVLEAGSRSEAVAFLVVNSGPGVKPAEQERYSARRSLESCEPLAAAAELAGYELSVTLARERASFSEVMARREELGQFAPTDALEWQLWVLLVDHDPEPAMRRLAIPVLALFGEDDPLVPVADSVHVFESAVRSGLLTVTVFRNADHRLQSGDPPSLVPGYLDTLTAFLDAVVR